MSSKSAKSAIEYTIADVLIGNARFCRENGGNQLLSRLVEERFAEYHAADRATDYLDVGRKKCKHDINKEIVAAIKAKGGRFLRKHKVTGEWVEVPERKAIARVANAFTTRKRTANLNRPAAPCGELPSPRSVGVDGGHLQAPIDSKPLRSSRASDENSLPDVDGSQLPLRSSRASDENSLPDVDGSQLRPAVAATAEMNQQQQDQQRNESLRCQPEDELHDVDYPLGCERVDHPGKAAVRRLVGESLMEYIEADQKASRTMPDGRALRSKQQIITDILQRLSDAGGAIKREEAFGSRRWTIVSQRKARQKIACDFFRAIKRQGKDSPNHPVETRELSIDLQMDQATSLRKSSQHGSEEKDDVEQLLEGEEWIWLLPEQLRGTIGPNLNSTNKPQSSVLLSTSCPVESPADVPPQGLQVLAGDGSMAVASDDFSSLMGVASDDFSLTLTSSMANDLILVEDVHSMSISQSGKMNTEHSSRSSLSCGSSSYRLPTRLKEGSSQAERASRLALPNIFEISTSSSEVTDAIDLKFKLLRENCCNEAIVIDTLRELTVFTVPRENSSVIRTAGGLDESGILILIDVMKRYSTNEEVQEHGCRSLGNLAATTTGSNKIEIAKRGGVELIVKAMRLFSTSSKIQENGCYVLGNMASNRENILAITELGGIGLVIQAMSRFPAIESLQKTGCLVLGNLASSTDDQKVAIARQGGIDVVLSAMETFSCNSGLQGKGCLALGNLAGNKDNQVSIARQGGIRLVVKAMEAFPSEEEIHRYGCLVLGNLGKSNEDNAVSISREGGVGLAIQAMKQFPDNELLQRYGCLAISSFATNSIIRSDVVNRGGVALVVRAMEIYAANTRLQEKGCLALGIFASDACNCAGVVEKGGIKLIVRAMKRFPFDEQVQELGCMALVNLARDDNGKAAIASQDGFDLITKTLRGFSCNEYIQQDCDWLLARLSALACTASQGQARKSGRPDHKTE